MDEMCQGIGADRHKKSLNLGYTFKEGELLETLMNVYRVGGCQDLF